MFATRHTTGFRKNRPAQEIHSPNWFGVEEGIYSGADSLEVSGMKRELAAGRPWSLLPISQVRRDRGLDASL